MEEEWIKNEDRKRLSDEIGDRVEKIDNRGKRQGKERNKIIKN